MVVTKDFELTLNGEVHYSSGVHSKRTQVCQFVNLILDG